MHDCSAGFRSSPFGSPFRAYLDCIFLRTLVGGVMFCVERLDDKMFFIFDLGCIPR